MSMSSAWFVWREGKMFDIDSALACASLPLTFTISARPLASDDIASRLHLSC
jgi:hypothetical protein